MSTKTARTQDETQAQAQWQKARRRSSSELLAVLAPTADEPHAIHRMAVWKTGPLAVPAPGGAA